MRFAGQFRIVVKQVPLAVKLHNGMVRGPALHRVQQNTLICKRAIRIVSNSIGNKMRITCLIIKFVFAILLLHPCGLKKTPVVIACHQGLAFFIYNLHIFYLAIKMEHIRTELRYFGA